MARDEVWEWNGNEWTLQPLNKLTHCAMPKLRGIAELGHYLRTMTS